jgi:hypothetical protein
MEFAEIDNSNVVLRVILVSESDSTDSNGVVIEEIGAAFCSRLTNGGTWLASGSPWKKNVAAIGYVYNADLNGFVPPKPYPSWTLSNEIEWEPPVAMPTDGEIYSWDEANQAWVNV